jgi:hypothetical protein
MSADEVGQDGFQGDAMQRIFGLNVRHLRHRIS